MKYEDVILRAPEPEDLELLYEWENDMEYWQISNTITPFSKYVLKRHIENAHKSIYENGQLRLMIELADDKTTIGTIDIFDFDPYHLRAGIGILIALKDQRRKGYAGMAIECVKNYCFDVLHLHQLWCNIVENNCSSIDLFKRAGFIEVGVKKDWLKTPDGFTNEILLQLLREEGKAGIK